MTYNAKILADSVSLAGVRLTTMEVTFPRFILPEFNTHRMFSRNSASSRAIPVEKMIQRVKENPFIPEYWGANQPGMQASQEINNAEKKYAEREWRLALNNALSSAQFLLDAGVHKQLANRLLEPFSWITVIISATEWDNFFALRCHPDAQPEIRKIAEMMRDEMALSTPQLIQEGEWHLPLTPDLAELTHRYDFEDIKRISAGRCARVSYLTHDGKRDPEKDIELCEKLITSGHMSPLEHVATPAFRPKKSYGNFKGWVQFRQEIPHEENFGARG